MAKISIAAASPVTDVEAAKFLHQRLKMSLLGSQKKLAMGNAGFFYTCELYGNDHVQREKEIRDIVSFFQQKNIELLLLEIESDQDWSDIDVQNLSKYSVSVDELLNALDSSTGLYE
ncbi:hypothetical protein K5D51_05415 [Pseudomonas cichorii]|nr:hypothetical protein [Pseudomonas cichorii]MBX8539085.1 hypothetical protein [Pseudomonas cichorii]MBX8553718.1 hypothetical protein [Pseudomonas cichorii]MBX8560252.1 hypothetical protein [Pseudomonas cichorii]MBX8579013.1 hypothetical protein [Pseudomonas cichorii]